MYAWRTLPDVSLTRATLRFAEFGFLGFAVNTCMTMPFRWGLSSSRGAFDSTFFGGDLRRMAWLSVLSVGAEEWKVLLVVNTVDVEHGWKTGNAARETKDVHDGVGRTMTLRRESIAGCTMLGPKKLMKQPQPVCRYR